MGNPNIIEIQNVPTIMNAGPIRIAEGHRPHRTVLRHLESEQKYVVHLELLRIDVDTRTKNGYAYDYVVFTSEGFDNGHYFEYGPNWRTTQEEALQRAKNKFEERM